MDHEKLAELLRESLKIEEGNKNAGEMQMV